MSDDGIDIANYDLDGLIDDLRGLAEYLADVPLKCMRPHELQDWRDRLETVRDYLRGVEIKCPDTGEDDEWDEEWDGECDGAGEAGEEAAGGEDERRDEPGEDDQSGE